jgi:predicted membrane protein
MLYRAFGGSVRDDPAKAIARATLVLIVLAAALGAATGVGFIAAIGGGVAIAVISIFAGVVLIATGLLGGPRWLILPVIVLVLPLAVVSAADIDLRGGVGEREYHPRQVADLQSQYKLGVGHMDLDLRDIALPAGETAVKVKLGMGEARVRVPYDACVITRGNIGLGAANVPAPVKDGFDVDLNEVGLVGAPVAPAAPGTTRGGTLVLDADIGVGHLQVDGTAARTGSRCA